MLTSLISYRNLFSINVDFIEIILVSLSFEGNTLSADIFCWKHTV